MPSALRTVTEELLLLRDAAVPAEDREGVTLLRVVRLPEEARVVVPLPAERAVEAEEALEERTVPLLPEELERAGVPPMLNEDPDAERVVLPEELERTVPLLLEELERTLEPLLAALERVVLPEELERAVLPEEPDRTGDCEDTAGELERVLLLTERLAALPELYEERLALLPEL